MENMSQVSKLLLGSMAQNMKFSLLAYGSVVCTSTMSHVQCVMWPKVLHKWWYQVVTCVPRDGHVSTGDTWWRKSTIIIVQCMYTCMDENPDYTQGRPTHANLNGALFFFVEGVSGSLPCKPYIAGRELTYQYEHIFLCWTLLNVHFTGTVNTSNHFYQLSLVIFFIYNKIIARWLFFSRQNLDNLIIYNYTFLTSSQMQLQCLCYFN
jgi:hypothetical protein